MISKLALGASIVSADPVKMIIDTDMGFDVDDVGAICVANALQDQGEVDILAVVHNTGFPIGIGAVSTINHFYGRGDIPLGAYKGVFASNDAAYGAQNKYAQSIIEKFPGPVKDYNDVPSAVEMYRKTLAAAEDNSVVISSIGMTTNMRDLLQSGADQYSELLGSDLVDKKVKQIVFMDGMYNFGCAEHDTYDWLGDDAGCKGSAEIAVNGASNLNVK
jgi:inosine-uridine nucleoside N-ribohydrolase